MEILRVVLLSLFVSLSATFIASFIGLSASIPVALSNSKFKPGLLRVTDALMSIPPVVMGLVVYLILSRKGPLGSFQLLYTPSAMIIAQVLLVTPIIFGLSVASISKNVVEIDKTCESLGAGKLDKYLIIFKECRKQMLSVITAGFGRAISEVGAVMMVGGNIAGHTRVMTTFIALETGKGNFSGSIEMGLILLSLSFIINFILHISKDKY